MSALSADLRARFDSAIRAPLRAVRRRLRAYVALDGGVRLLLAMILASLVQIVLDWWLRLSVDQRATMNVVITLIWLWVIYRRLVSPLLAPVSERLLAAAVDRAHPQLHDGLSTAVQFESGETGPHESNSPALIAAVVEETCRRVHDVRFSDVLDHGRARRGGVELAGLVGIVVLAYALAPDLMRIWFQRNWLIHEVSWPQRTTITPIGFDDSGRRRAPRGEELDLAAAIEGVVPTAVTLQWWTESGRRGAETMAVIGEAPAARAAVALGALHEPITFRIVGGDESTREYRVEPVDRPFVESMSIRVTPPAYTRVEPTVLTQETTIELLRGSSLEIDARMNKPLESARFAGPGGAVAPCELIEPDRARIAWSDPQPGIWSFELRDRDGAESVRGVRYTIKLTSDAPPVVKLSIASVSDIVTPLAELSIEATFNDVYGLSRVMVAIQRNDDAPVSLPVEGFREGDRDVRASLAYALDALAVQPGDRLRVFAESADNDPAGPNLGRAEAMPIRVLTPSDFLNEMAKREMELRQEFERLISEQGGMRDALERAVAGLRADEAPAGAASQRLAGLARRQDSHATRSTAIRRGFERILAEMRQSRVARGADEQRLGGRIAAPLDEIASVLMPRASSTISGLRRMPTAEALHDSPAQQSEIVRRMRIVLKNMLELEGYREAVALLQEIIAEQKDVRAGTIEALSGELDSIFEDDSPKKPASEAAKP